MTWACWYCKQQFATNRERMRHFVDVHPDKPTVQSHMQRFMELAEGEEL